MKIGILGGTFNPPHIGHLILAEEVREKVPLNKIFFIPTNLPPHKGNDGTPAFHRLKMVQLTVEENDFFEALDLEVKRGGVSYTIDTLKELKNNFPEDTFWLIVGSDLANIFPVWKDFAEIKKMVKIVVAQREKDPFSLERLKAQAKNLNDDFTVTGITQVNLSSSEIRKRVKEGRSIKYLVKDKVAEYIEKNSLYR